MMKKRMTALLLSLMLLLSAVCTVSAAQTTGFTDVPEGAYYYDAVNWAVENDITQGVGDGQFQPSVICKRAQVVTFLWRLAGKPVAGGKSAFTDVPEDAYYNDAVNWAVKKDITQGTGDGQFQPDGTCSRAQIGTFLWRYAGEPASNAKTPFTDVPEGAWYADAVAWAVEQGITTGKTNTTFEPTEPCNRAQVVTFLYRYANIEPPVDDPNMGEWA